MKIFLRFAFIALGFCAMVNRLPAQTDVLTQHNDFSRTGWNQTESILKVSNVIPSKFGLLTSRTVDDQIYAQPLVVTGVDINNTGVPTNIVYVATVNNTIYAFDADDGTIPVYWSHHMTTPGFRPPQNTDMHPNLGTYNDFYDNTPPFVGFFGIVGTPVIDKSTNTLYVVTREVNTAIYDAGPHNPVTGYNSNGFYQYLHAIDIRDGSEKLNSPVLITASATGTSPANQSGIVHFDPRRENQRGGLLLLNGIVYIPYAAHGDWQYYSGWILGYDASNLQQKITHLVTPNDGGGGVWMSGGGLAADPAANGGKGSIYYASGNSFNGNPAIAANRGESIVRMDPNGTGSSATALNLGDYFTPTDYISLNSADLDFGTQVMLVPNTNLLVTGSKDQNLYVLDKTNLGGYSTSGNSPLVKKIFVANNAQMHASFAYFGGSTHKYFYQFSENTNLKAYPVNATALGGAMNGVSNGPVGASGSYMSTSSNGADETTGILWIAHAKAPCNANQQGPCSGILRAVEAVNVNHEIWNSDMNAVDNVGKFAKMVCPTVANGKVYLATQSSKLNVYGMLASNPRCVTNVALNKPATDINNNTSNAKNAFDGNLTTSWQSFGQTDYLQVDLGASYDICRFTITWQNAAGTGTDYNIQVADNPAGPWMTVESMTNNIELYNEFNGDYTGRYIRMQGVRLNAGVFAYNIEEFTVLGEPASTCTKPLNLVAGNVNQTAADISWDAVSGASSYLLRYKTPVVNSWVTRTTTSLTQSLGALTCGADYTVEVQTICSASDQSSFSSLSLTTDDCTTPCTLPTRYNHADIGDIGMAGSSCLNGGIFTIKGSGNHIGSTNDQFQFAFTNLAGDEDFTAHLTSQDLTGSLAGIMMRDSVSDTSPFAYIAIKAGSGAQFIYRSVSGGNVTVIQGGASLAAPVYLRLSKSGTVYSAYTSPSGIDGSWTLVGTVDLGFGSTNVSPGLAVTSANNSSLATATFDSYEESAPLPISLLSFTATNINNEYISIKWTTSMEENNDRFVIERSTDGMHFDWLTTVKSAGNSSTEQSYVTADNHPVNGLNFYRIKQYDRDGKVSVFPVAMVKFGAGAGPVVYPNPASDLIHIVSGEETIQSVGLYDLLGKVIRIEKNPGAEADLKLTISNLSSGVYILKITTPSKVYQQKVMKN